MCKICPKCGSIAEYDAYYGRTICTRCEWESEKEQVKKYTLVKKDTVSRSKKNVARKLVNA